MDTRLVLQPLLVPRSLYAQPCRSCNVMPKADGWKLQSFLAGWLRIRLA